MITLQELRDHAVADHKSGCMASNHFCDCGYDKVTERLLRAAAKRIEELQATARGYRERAALENESKKEPRDG